MGELTVIVGCNLHCTVLVFITGHLRNYKTWPGLPNGTVPSLFRC